MLVDQLKQCDLLVVLRVFMLNFHWCAEATRCQKLFVGCCKTATTFVADCLAKSAFICKQNSEFTCVLTVSTKCQI